MVVPCKPRWYWVDSKSPRKQLSPIAVSLATTSKKKNLKKDKKLSNWAKHWSIYTGRCDGTTCLPDECFESLPAPAPATSSSAAAEFYTHSLSTPPTTVPWTPFPHFFPLLRCFICAFPFLPLSTYTPPPFKKR